MDTNLEATVCFLLQITSEIKQTGTVLTFCIASCLFYFLIREFWFKKFNVSFAETFFQRGNLKFIFTVISLKWQRRFPKPLPPSSSHFNTCCCCCQRTCSSPVCSAAGWKLVLAQGRKDVSGTLFLEDLKILLLQINNIKKEEESFSCVKIPHLDILIASL